MKLTTLATALVLLLLMTALPAEAAKGGNGGGNGGGNPPPPPPPPPTYPCVTVAEQCIYQCAPGNYQCNGLASQVANAQTQVDHAPAIVACYRAGAGMSVYSGHVGLGEVSHLQWCMNWGWQYF